MPDDATGVYSIWADSLHSKLSDPTQTASRPVDRYTGRVLGLAAFWKGGAVVMLLSALAFPLAGGVLFAVLLIDGLLIARWPALKARLS